MSSYFEDNWFEDEHSRSHWDDQMQEAGCLVPEFLWDALIAARKQCADQVPFQQIAKDEALKPVFIDAVRKAGFIGSSLTDEVILTATNAMPERCDYCHLEDFAHCETCGGCTMCCCSDYHCATCGLPMGFCQQCPQVSVDSEGNHVQEE